MASRQEQIAIAKAEADAKLEALRQTTQENELVASAATAPTQAEAELRETTDHTNYLTEFETRAEQIKTETSTAATNVAV